MPNEHLNGVKTALFMDFDNVYGSLLNVSVSAANKFARDPSKWLRWLEEGGHEALATETDDVRPRQILVRRCYLNPVHFGNYRAAFTRSGFSVIDCPPLTSKAKNSADIYMVMDIMDTLNHKTAFEEFIILSSDADFTPVLLRLREYDRRSMIISNLVTAAPLKAACDFFVELDEFIEDALELERIPAPPQPMRVISRTPAISPPVSSNTPEKVLVGTGPLVAASPSETKQAVQEYVQQMLARSSRPVLLSYLGLRIQNDVGRHVKESGWCGYDTLTGLVKAIQKDLGFEIAAAGTTKACIYDPSRHQAPTLQSEGSALPGLRPELAEFIDRMNKSVGLPRLSPTIFQQLFEIIADALNHGFTEHFALLSAVERMCYERKLPVRREAINFALAGLSQGGYQFAEGPHTSRGIADAFFESTMDLCAAAQMQLSPEERLLFGEWLGTSRTNIQRSGGENERSQSVDTNENAPQSEA